MKIYIKKLFSMNIFRRVIATQNYEYIINKFIKSNLHFYDAFTKKISITMLFSKGKNFH